MYKTLKFAGCAALMMSATAFTATADVDPAEKSDRSWVSVSGIVAQASDDWFVLDYGKGSITVEMDDWDWYAEGKGLLEGDDVVVYGRVDKDLYELARIEADSVYVKDLNAYFYANDADEEDVAYHFAATPKDGETVTYTGNVTTVDGREFTLDTGFREIRIDTSEMFYNPMDDKGFQQVRKGDFVRVYGEIDDGLFKKKELLAGTIITLVKDRTKTIKATN